LRQTLEQLQGALRLNSHGFFKTRMATASPVLACAKALPKLPIEETSIVHLLQTTQAINLV